MGPATLLCPSSSAAHLWRQSLPWSKAKQKEGTLSMSPRCFAIAGDLTGRPPCFLHSASPSGKYRKCITWRRVSGAAAASEVSVEEAVVEGAVAIADTEQSTVNAEQSVADAEESVPASRDEVTITSGTSTDDVTPVTTEKTQARRTLVRSNSKKNITISPAELVPGAQFPGKVVSIQTFGAFVDFGAFTNGLAHISRLSKSFVRKVEDVVQVGQDVKVQILEVDFEANRISLMLIGDAVEEVQQAEGKGGAPSERASQQQTRAPRRDAPKRMPTQRNTVATTLKKGEIVVGKVKNMIRSGVFLSLPDGTDGYLPVQEVIFKAPNTALEAQFEVGEEVTVRVLRLDRGRINLTMKKEMNFDKLNEDLNKGVIGMATNPFELAFRRNEVIASYLAERDKQKVQAEEVKEEAQAATEDVKEEATEEVKEEVKAQAATQEDKEEVKAQAATEEVKEEVEAATEEVKEEAEAATEEVKVEEVKEEAQIAKEVKEEAQVGSD